MNQLILDYAKSHLGLPYRWGGSNPMIGFDCSGLTIEILQAAGVLKRHTDYTAQGLYDLLVKQGIINKREAGSVSFYGKSFSSLTHVTFHLDAFYVMEAGSGDSKTVSLEAAIKQNAFVRVNPFNYRADYLVTVMPTYPIVPEK